MQIELKVPSVGESITEVEIGEWLKNEGDSVSKDQGVVVLESEKTTLELPAPVAGVVVKVLKRKGETAKVGDVIGLMQQQDGASTNTESAPKQAMPAAAPAASSQPEARVMPAAARVMAEQGIRWDPLESTCRHASLSIL